MLKEVLELPCLDPDRLLMQSCSVLQPVFHVAMETFGKQQECEALQSNTRPNICEGSQSNCDNSSCCSGPTETSANGYVSMLALQRRPAVNGHVTFVMSDSWKTITNVPFALLRELLGKVECGLSRTDRAVDVPLTPCKYHLETPSRRHGNHVSSDLRLNGQQPAVGLLQVYNVHIWTSPPRQNDPFLDVLLQCEQKQRLHFVKYEIYHQSISKHNVC